MSALAGLMLGCEIPEVCKFDRKNYFYPDMPKNYQITQFDAPICVGGAVPLHDFAYPKDAQKSIAQPGKTVRLTRIHLEEDVAKSQHFETSTGIDFNRGGQSRALGRFVVDRVRVCGLPDEGTYVDSLTGPTHPEVVRLVNAVTVGHSWFYRDGVQLEELARYFREGFSATRTIRAWVAGCSTGEDAYTLAMLALRENRQIHVLGTDINSDVLVTARAATYGAWSLWELPAPMQRFFRPPQGGRHQVKHDVMTRVQFQQQNLMEAPPEPPDAPAWDLILCRNVLIYFQPPAVTRVMERLAGVLCPAGWLVLGSGEVLQHHFGAHLVVAPLGARYGLRRSGQQVPPRTPPASHVPPPPRVNLAPLAAPTGAPAVTEMSLLEEASQLLERGQYAQALVVCQRVVQEDPLCVLARLWMGIAHHLSGDAIAAAHALRSALVLDPLLWPAAYYLAVSYEKSGLRQEAAREYRRVLETCAVDPVISFPSSVLTELYSWKAEIVAMCQRQSKATEGR